MPVKYLLKRVLICICNLPLGEHNTGKCLIGCTPNGVISYVLQLYVGSTHKVNTLAGKRGSSIMADRSCTICVILSDVGVDLNFPWRTKVLQK